MLPLGEGPPHLLEGDGPTAVLVDALEELLEAFEKTDDDRGLSEEGMITNTR